MNLTQLDELMTTTPDVHAPLESVIYSLTMNVKKGSRYRHSDTATLPDGTTIRASTDGYVVERNGAAQTAPTAQDAARLASAPVSTALVAVGSAVGLLPYRTGWRDVIPGGVYCAEFSDLCARMPDASADMILCDLPYEVTPASWDVIIPLETMWKAFKRIIKPRGAIVLTAVQPFTSMLVMSNLAMYRHEWVWNKKLAGNFLLAKHQPLKIHETVLVFSTEPCTYYPQMRKGVMRDKGGGKSELWQLSLTTATNDDYYPVSILEYANTDRNSTFHPTQKPVELFDALIRTYTQPGELVFDPCVGSGTTAVAARLSGREFIVGDQDAGYCEIARQRVASVYGVRELATQTDMFAAPAA